MTLLKVKEPIAEDKDQVLLVEAAKSDFGAGTAIRGSVGVH
ncbi:hypothetical protein [Rhodococcus opacus]|nr:hypothetical protein [Rhodococcus opacus]